MHFQHSADVWTDFPELVPGVLHTDGITSDASVAPQLAPYLETAKTRLASASESELPEIRAWRRTFARMGLKPTQYRCASESLLRRFRKEGSIPQIHPLIDLCNAVSLAFAIPVAVFDVAEIAGYLVVRRATGVGETYLAFSGESETPGRGEVIFADGARYVHARRWTNRQSGLSAVRDNTTAVLVVAEAMHDTADADVRRLTSALGAELGATWSVTPKSAILTKATPRFEW